MGASVHTFIQCVQVLWWGCSSLMRSDVFVCMATTVFEFFYMGHRACVASQIKVFLFRQFQSVLASIIKIIITCMWWWNLCLTFSLSNFELYCRKGNTVCVYFSLLWVSITRKRERDEYYTRVHMANGSLTDL